MEGYYIKSEKDARFYEVALHGETVTVDGQVIDEYGVFGERLAKKILSEKDWNDFDELLDGEDNDFPLVVKFNPEAFGIEFEVGAVFYSVPILKSEK